MNLEIADCGLRIADCGLRIADCVLRHGSWPVSRSERNTELSMNLANRTGRSPGPSDLRFTMYDLRGSDGGIAALRDSNVRRSALRGARKSYMALRAPGLDRHVLVHVAGVEEFEDFGHRLCDGELVGG